jgi:tryptophan-rich hypothetical protein
MLENFLDIYCRSNMQTKPFKLNPKKLLHSKWTAVKPVNKEKHFMVTKLIFRDEETQVIEAVEIEAVMTWRVQVIDWHALQDRAVWKQGWVA